MLCHYSNVRSRSSGTRSSASELGRMRREPHVRFCERAAVKFHRATHLVMGFEKEDHARRMVPAQRGVRRPETLAFRHPRLHGYCGGHEMAGLS